ncbi:hypothetical protein Bbelb_259250 [Branchiostoma belcheri]|nr:hypothetical protein Bbelb_259250 [Branchiostoma belcheri]
MSEDVEEIATGTDGEDAAPRPGQDPEEPGGAVPGPVVAEDSIREGPTRHPRGEEREEANIQHPSVSQRLPSGIANMTVTEQQLNKLAMKLGSGWENLAVHLGLSMDDVDTIKEENRKSNVQKLKMLLAWKAKQKGGATVGNLVRALEAYDDTIDEDKFDFFLDETPEEPSNNTQISETSGPRHYQNEDRSAPATGEVYPDSPATFQVNGVKVHFPEGSVEGVRTISVEVEHPVVRNQRQREILQHGVCGPLITVVQSSGGRFRHPVTVTVDLQYPAGSKQSEPNEDLRWHLLRHTDANGWEDVTDFNPHVTDTTIEYKTSEFCRHWLVKLTEHAVLPFMERIEDFIQDYYNPLVVFVMYQGQHGAVVFDCLLKSDPTLKQLVLKSGYNQRVVPMDQTEEVRAKLEGNVAFTGGDSAMTGLTFQHPRKARGDLNKKEVFLCLRDGANPNHRGYISYSIAQRTVTKMPILVAAPSLTSILNASLNTSEFPADWKKARVVPIFKAGDRTDTAPYRTPSREVLSRLGWMSVRTLHRQHKAMLVYRALDNSLPPHMRGVFIRYRDEASRSTRQSTLDNLIIPRPQLEVYRRSLRYSGATVWNSLPPHCPPGQAISVVKSRHCNTAEDRVWEFLCKVVPNLGDFTSHYWSEWVNEFDGVMNYVCPSGRVVTGFNSEHSNTHEDRRWKLRCSRKDGMTTSDHYESLYANSWDGDMNYYVPNGFYLRGMHGYHDNEKEDRLYGFDLCQVQL